MLSLNNFEIFLFANQYDNLFLSAVHITGPLGSMSLKL